jgi:hypothetical protein
MMLFVWEINCICLSHTWQLVLQGVAIKKYGLDALALCFRELVHFTTYY